MFSYHHKPTLDAQCHTEDEHNIKDIEIDAFINESSKRLYQLQLNQSGRREGHLNRRSFVEITWAALGGCQASMCPFRKAVDKAYVHHMNVFLEGRWWWWATWIAIPLWNPRRRY